MKPDSENVSVLSLLMKALPDGERKFKIYADGVEISPGNLAIVGEDCAWMVGIRPEGWQGVLYREHGGGGNVTVPWARGPDGEILVGMVQETRPNMGTGTFLCALGGMISRGESREEAHLREDLEEAGLDTRGATELPGLGTAQDRLFYVSSVEKGEGVRCYEKEYPLNQLEPTGDGTWRAKPGIVDHKKESLLLFSTMRDASLKSGDALVQVLIVKLMIHLGML